MLRKTFLFSTKRNIRNVLTCCIGSKVSIKGQGLFSCPGLITPKDFLKLSKQSSQRTDYLISIINKTGDQGTRLDIKKSRILLYLLDSISNEICTVIDVAELCRNIHENEEFRNAADEAFTEISNTIHKINANSNVYKIVKRIYDVNVASSDQTPTIDDPSLSPDIRNLITSLSRDYKTHFTEEEVMFITELKNEFESDGVHLPQPDKELLLQLQTEIVNIETDMVDNITNNDNQIFPLQPVSSFHSASLKAWISKLIDFDKLGYKDDHLTNSSILCTSHKRVSLPLLKSLGDEPSRKNLYFQTCFEPYANLSKLGELIQKRRSLSVLLSRDSYSHKVLQKQTLKAPDQVMSILQTISTATRAGAEKELEQLQKLKYERELSTSKINSLSGLSEIHPWDISYYSSVYTSIAKQRAQNAMNNHRNIHGVVGAGNSSSISGSNNSYSNSSNSNSSSPLAYDDISSYLSLNHCLNGLFMISKELFDIDFVYAPFLQHEAWVVFAGKNSVVDSPLSSPIFDFFSSSTEVSEEEYRHSLKTGLLKFDIYKSSSRNHTTTKTNTSSNINNDRSTTKRPISDKIGTLYLDLYQRNAQGKFPGSAMFTISGGCRQSYHEHIGTHPQQKLVLDQLDTLQTLQLDSIQYQLPKVALLLNISPHKMTDNLGALLSLQDLETLHHEWGHMLHSILSRTQFQHLSGTRTATDFSEVPSHIFEYFARTSSVVSQWARHWKTNEIMSESLFDEHIGQSCELKLIDLQTQILYSAADQYMFGLGTDTPLERPEDTYWRMMPAVCQLQQSLTCLPFAKNPDQALQVILDQRRHISITGVTATSAMSGASHEKYNTKTLRILQHDLRKHDITRLPAIMPCSHSHFVAYGACYYSYMFAKMYAAQIWETKFKRNPLCRKSGEELLTIMLQYGASKDPQSILDVIAGGSLDPTYFIKSLIK